MWGANGQSDFEKNHGIISNYLNTLEEIKANDTNHDLQIVMLMDCFNSSSKFKDGYYYLTGGNFNDDLVEEKTEINSGSVTATKSFMDWVIANYPAQKYFFWHVRFF